MKPRGHGRSRWDPGAFWAEEPTATDAGPIPPRAGMPTGCAWPASAFGAADSTPQGQAQADTVTAADEPPESPPTNSSAEYEYDDRKERAGHPEAKGEDTKTGAAGGVMFVIPSRVPCDGPSYIQGTEISREAIIDIFAELGFGTGERDTSRGRRATDGAASEVDTGRGSYTIRLASTCTRLSLPMNGVPLSAAGRECRLDDGGRATASMTRGTNLRTRPRTNGQRFGQTDKWEDPGLYPWRPGSKSPKSAAFCRDSFWRVSNLGFALETLNFCRDGVPGIQGYIPGSLSEARMAKDVLFGSACGDSLVSDAKAYKVLTSTRDDAKEKIQGTAGSQTPFRRESKFSPTENDLDALPYTT
ncbi:hypothetical protein C8F04DRAFT_1227343 [Mycena alexandri]|uniref:Uncharacterized protein n=1 Tax=Mycena alexandri TaxID=1745969 RepID=A0AAD6XDL1_9AGAR|nr:hypothetical protein C8F04DRAFT_1227343 [Mycena alexandri]